MNRPGIWLRAGMGGEIGGLAMAEALASLPEHCDREFSRQLLIVIERAFLSAHWAKDKGDKDG